MNTITSIQNGIIWKLTFLLSGSQWENYKKSTKIRRLQGIVTRVLHIQFI